MGTFATLSLMTALLCGCAADDFDSEDSTGVSQKEGFSKQLKRAPMTDLGADFEVWYSTDGKLDIGVVRADKGKNPHHRMMFTMDDLEGFFDGQKHKGFILVTIAKNAWKDEELNEHLERLTGYFFARGYERIMIEQAHGGLGRLIHLDYQKHHAAEQDGVE